MEKWSDEIINNIRANLEDTNPKDLRFLRIDELIRNIERTGNYLPRCRECLSHKSEIVSLVPIIEEAVKTPGKNRKQLDRLTGTLSRHMMKAHGFYFPYYFSYLYAFVGIIGGLLLGLLGRIIYPHDEITLISGFAVGLISGYVTGTRKDNRIRKNKKLM